MTNLILVFGIVRSALYSSPFNTSKVFTRHELTLVVIGGAVLENSVKVVINYYDVESPTPYC